MSTGKKKKISAGKRKFRRFLRIYASILGIATIVVCIIVWGRLKIIRKAMIIQNQSIVLTNL